MNAVVFVGPTLREAEVHAALPGAVVRGPVECGDVHRALLGGARAIGIIDGFFEHRLSVWHKEILWALHQGVPVYGAASMGALRAAELQPYGMIGIGRVYEDYAAGILEADDEVAVLHEAADQGYRVRSDALVNLRATFAAAVAATTLKADVATRLTCIAKALHYSERSLAAVLAAARDQSVVAADTPEFGAWLSCNGVVDQKRCDALALLARKHADRSAPPVLAPIEFEYTDVWHALRTSIEIADQPAPAQQIRALERALALTLAKASGARVDLEAAQQASERFRRKHGLLTPAATVAWLARCGLSLESFSRYIADDLLAASYLPQARSLAQKQIAPARTEVDADERGDASGR